MRNEYQPYYDLILSRIDATGYDTQQPDDAHGLLQFLADTFKSEYGHEIARHGWRNALTEYLPGLPSCCTLPFYNYEILEFARKNGRIPENAKESQEDYVLRTYWRFMAMRISELFAFYGINI